MEQHFRYFAVLRVGNEVVSMRQTVLVGTLTIAILKGRMCGRHIKLSKGGIDNIRRKALTEFIWAIHLPKLAQLAPARNASGLHASLLVLHYRKNISTWLNRYNLLRIKFYISGVSCARCVALNWKELIKSWILIRTCLRIKKNNERGCQSVMSTIGSECGTEPEPCNLAGLRFGRTKEENRRDTASTP